MVCLSPLVLLQQQGWACWHFQRFANRVSYKTDSSIVFVSCGWCHERFKGDLFSTFIDRNSTPTLRLSCTCSVCEQKTPIC